MTAHSGTQNGRHWTLCAAAVTLEQQVDANNPTRSRAGDGTIGDASHQGRTSDHNPDSNGYVCAIDFTHDPAHNFDSYKFADYLSLLRDPRIAGIGSYNIHTRSERWWSPAHGWRDQNLAGGSHAYHIHISFTHDNAAYHGSQLFSPGGFHPTPPPPTPHTPYPGHIIQRGSTDHANTKIVQKNLNAHGISCSVDGDFGPQTEGGVRTFQTRSGIGVDGRVGPVTWGKLVP